MCFFFHCTYRIKLNLLKQNSFFFKSLNEKSKQLNKDIQLKCYLKVIIFKDENEFKIDKLLSCSFFK